VELSRTSVGLNGIQWNLVGLNGTQWNSVELGGTHNIDEEKEISMHLSQGYKAP